MGKHKQRAKGTGSIYQNTRGQWVAAMEVGWSVRGTRQRVTFKARTEAEVRAKLADAQMRLAVEGPAASFSSITVKRWADIWLAERQRTVRPGTYVSDRSAVCRWIIPAVGHIRLDALTPMDIRRVANQQESSGLALTTMRRTHAVLGKLLTDAVAEGYRVSQRARETASPGSGVTTRQPLSVEDATKILQVAAGRVDASRWIAALIEGLRPAEALGLTWEMVDLDAGTMTLAWQLKALPYAHTRDPESGFRVPRGFESRHLVGAYHLVRPKTRSGIRVIPLVPRLVEALRVWKGQVDSPYDLVWPREDGSPRSADFDRNQWYELAQEARVEMLLPDGTIRHPLLYEARHTAATMMLANGIDETTIKAVLGHSSVLSTQTYLHTDQTRTRMALMASAEMLGLGDKF
ncbi:site-specific integrase [Corynebacterium sp. SCR221107]|uniref:tyrosine-type recombinase/integrase n=1 Tax=Corynebacterium sp. SCR221107 TaxID=3017361 RepID=UPI0022EC7E66|nr:site-specific integrase [Corynebacterium sp. SCR221107]WBT09185.1 site-specific integrase [Corynebacterium sp. SCR221107]